MIAAFSTDELVTSSVTGRVQVGEPVRKALDPNKVQAIVGKLLFICLELI